MQVVYLFPGQGAQYVGMGSDVYSLAPTRFHAADQLLGEALSELMFRGPQNALTQTRNSQCAIFVHSMALLGIIQQRLPQLSPVACAGLSLGEYSALCASGRLSFEETLGLVRLRGQLMNDACESTEGTMAVVLGLSADEVEELVEEAGMPNDLWAANFNCPGQVVLSGTPAGIAKGTELAKARGAKRVMPLSVHGAFHSGLMAEAQERLAPAVHAARFQPSDIPLVMNVPGDYVFCEQTLRQNLIQQVTHAVRWEQGIRHIEAKGVDLYVEIGPSSLAAMNKRIGVSAPTITIDKVADIEKLSDALAATV